jgi:hypothetical protein
LLDPGLNQGDFAIEQRCFAFRHADLTVLWRDHFENGTLFGIAGNDRRAFAVSASEEAFEIGHHVAALILGGLMAALAVSLEDRADLAVVADVGRLFIFCSGAKGA